MNTIMERAYKIQRELDRAARHEATIASQKAADFSKMGTKIPNFSRISENRVLTADQRKLAERANAAPAFEIAAHGHCVAAPFFSGPPSSKPHAVRPDKPGMGEHFSRWLATATMADLLD
jgi:hypothetical protein